MAENNVEAEHEWSDWALDSAEDTLIAMETLLATLRAFEDVLRQQPISMASSTEYCDNFCQALMHYAGSRNSMEHGLPLLEVYCLSINCFAAARSHLTAESDRVALVLKRLALSCFELLLSVPENEIPFEAWVQFNQSVQIAHDSLLQFGSTDLQALLQITGEGGAWSNPILTALLTGQATNPDEVEAYILLEGEGFMEMRVKHLEKMGEVAKAVVLAKACSECSFIPNQAMFRQTFVSLLCHLLPNEEAIIEISRLDCKDVLEITCNLEMEGEENTAFILCTTFLTQQLQQQNLYCSWELTLLWSKLQRRLDPSLVSLLERCLQLGAIAKTVQHLLYLVRVIQTEAEELGTPASVELCVKALQLPKQEDSETRISVCKTISCLLRNDLEVLRACQLTELLLGSSQEAFTCLEELYLRPDQKYDQENEVIPNSLRCELLLALKAYWPFDPEFWDWKTLKYHCNFLLGLNAESEGEGEQEKEVKTKKLEVPVVQKRVETDLHCRINGGLGSHEHQDKKEPHPEVDASSEVKREKFCCKICKRSFTDTQIVHHSKRHSQENNHLCPVCLEKFKSRKDLVPHMKKHIGSKSIPSQNNTKDDEEDDVEPGEITLDPSLVLYYNSTRDPDLLHHIVQQTKTSKEKSPDDDEYVTFDYIEHHFKLQNRDEYPCPGTKCKRVFKHSKYLYVHLKSDHKGDENVKYFHQMRDKREKCVFCRRHFVSAYHHRKHRRAHYGDQPYTCVVVGCGAKFSTSNELVVHKQTHGYQLSYQCELQGCYVTYADLGQLYHHEAQHFRDAAFACCSTECKKYFLSKKEFMKHLSTHKITFTEEDFEAQRKAKRKLFKIITEPPVGFNQLSDPTDGVNGEVLNPPSMSCASSVEDFPNKEPKATMTLVAVCFDGSKFTCGFEKCGMTFSRARDVQRHLKCAHPEHLKLENREHKHDKEQGSKGMDTNVAPDGEEKETDEHSAPLKPVETDKKTATPPKSNETSFLSRHAKNDGLKEILLGLSKLSLNSVPLSSPSEPSQSSQDASLKFSHQAILEKPPVVLLNKNSDMSDEQMVVAKEEYTESLGNAKPYVCVYAGCGFRTAKSYSLLRHYISKHGCSLEEARKMTSFKTTSFKPYACQLCSKSHREKHVLRAHYIQAHKMSGALVDKISCGTVQLEQDKKSSSQPLSNIDPKGIKKETVIMEHQQKSNTPSLISENGQNSDNHSPSEGEGEDEVGRKEDNEEQKEEDETKTTQQVRTRRLVAKNNLCYILDKFSKPFHCVAKNCDAAFSTQGGLVRHLQFIHHYNRSQLLLDKDSDVQGPEVRKEPARKRAQPNPDEPQPQFKCHFANCHAVYHLKSSLVRHTRDFHSQPPELIRCKHEGCSRVFSHSSALKKHMLYSHCEYYDSLVVRLQSTHKKSITGCQNKLVVSQEGCQKTDAGSPDTHDGTSSPRAEGTEQLEENRGNSSQKKKESGAKKSKRANVSDLVLRSHEEALQMCQDRCLRMAYPCMVQGCDSVVKYLHSVHRHYMKVHHLGREELHKNADTLVFHAERLEELIQRKSAQPAATGAGSPNEGQEKETLKESESPEEQPEPTGVPSVPAESESPEEQPEPTGVPAESESPEEQPEPTGFPSVPAETQDGGSPDPPISTEEQKEEKEEPSPVETNEVPVGSNEVVEGEASTDEKPEEMPVAPQSSPKLEERLSLDQIRPLLRPVTVDLSPPYSLRFAPEESSQDTSEHKEDCKMVNGSAAVSSPTVRLPLKRKNEISEQPSNVKDTQPSSPQHSFDITAYKPIGFESSFLKFIQETAPKDEEALVKRRDTFKRSCSVKENHHLGISHTRGRRTHSPLLKSNSTTGDFTSIQNLKSILDKALAGCGDLAIKQLQFLKPVVVLGRPVCTTLPDLFPSDTNNSKLLLGS
ncbi:zinc finger protein Rlf isoform X1 [Oryzias latipes]|uniref:RLF zinc finger n=2 Tax=Oryzias latipes TaxID=8090 RepID=A0A3B3HB67_ORYLA|nr:zinc finger protein Rlf isoform X1 [Oryzias latipes]